MRKCIYLALAIIFSLCATACSAAVNQQPEDVAPVEAAVGTQVDATEVQVAEPPATGKTELIVFAAASMTETLEEIAKLYAQEKPDVKLVFNFDSSGTLKTQIQEGAECDLFISAGQKQMDQLDISADESVNTESLDFVLEGSRLNLLENRVVLVVPGGNPKEVSSFEVLAKKLSSSEILLAMGNSDVPVGQYTQKILQYFNLDEQNLASAGVLTYGSNVKEVTTQVAESSVDCGVVYCTDAFSANLEIVDYATADMCGQVIYPAAVIKTSKNIEAANEFLQYITSREASAVFEKVGFSTP